MTRRLAQPTLPLAVLAIVSTLVGCRNSSSDPPQGHTEPVATTTPTSTPTTTPTAIDEGRRGGTEPIDSPPSGSPFGLYVLALSWAPNFCCGHSGKEQCTGLPDTFAATHLTLHGLWPNYTDAESKAKHAAYPQFCGDYKRCKSGRDKSCEPSPSTIPAEMKKLGPGYVGDNYFLADHEWPKHGSCTGLDAATYFKAALDAMKARPGDEGTPEALRAAIGKTISRTDLQNSFGAPPSSVLLSCDAQCRLTQVGICLAHDNKGLPTTATECPANTTSSNYDNGCFTHNCTQISVQAAGSCDIGKKTTPVTPRGDDTGGKNACNHPGQGPACTSDASCVSAGFKRCARTGCCTSQP